MCGIVGIASSHPAENRARLTGMLATLAHRGPDDSGEWWSNDGRVGLGHRRLAIIDLSPAGHQPLIDPSARASITLNGEIYNYRELREQLASRGHEFRGASDTEVLLAAYLEWGEACVERLNGMFAFGVYDSANRRLFLARDRAGEKPLYYRHVPHGLIFASELKALMADPTLDRMIDIEALDHYLAYGYVPGELCMLRGVRKLEPAHTLLWDVENGSTTVRRYWELPCFRRGAKDSAEDLTARLETLLEASVRRQLVADVPVGVLLSGGIDSSLVTALAARVSSSPIKTYTVSFPGHQRLDEAPFARRIAGHFGTDHTELRAEEAPVDLLPGLARQCDEPIADSALVPTAMLSQLIRQHATVALGGDGGDELFGGYPHYRWLMRADRARAAVPRWMRRAVGLAAGRTLPPGTRGRNHLVGFQHGTSESIAHVNLYFDRATRRRLLVPAVGCPAREVASPEGRRARLCPAGDSVLRQATEADFRSTLADGYLVKVDRASMLHGLEVRAPWLDVGLIEFAFRDVPDELRATESEGKILPKRLARRLLPADIDLRRKQGFTMPLEAWFTGPWGAFAVDVLRGAPTTLFARAEIDRILAAQRRGFANTQRLYALTFFELWRREYGVGW